MPSERVQGLADEPARRAYVLTQLTGPVAVGDRVVRQHHGGRARPRHRRLARRALEPGPGDLARARTGPHHQAALHQPPGRRRRRRGAPPRRPRHADGTPVVACTVHSQVASVVVAVPDARPDTRIAYVMTDGAALPIALRTSSPCCVERDVVAAP